LDQLLVGPEKAQKAQIICLAIYGALTDRFGERGWETFQPKIPHLPDDRFPVLELKPVLG